MTQQERGRDQAAASGEPAERERELLLLLAAAGGELPRELAAPLLGLGRAALDGLVGALQERDLLRQDPAPTTTAALAQAPTLALSPAALPGLQQREVADPGHRGRLLGLLGQLRLLFQLGTLSAALPAGEPRRNETQALLRAAVPAAVALAPSAFAEQQAETVLDLVEGVLPFLRAAGDSGRWIALAELAVQAAGQVEERATRPGATGGGAGRRTVLALLNLAYGHQAAGHWSETVRCLGAARELAQRRGETGLPTPDDLLVHADLLLQRLDAPERALPLLRELLPAGAEGVERLAPLQQVQRTILLAEAQSQLGEPLEALRLLGEALVLALPQPEPVLVGLLDRAVGLLRRLAETGRWRELALGCSALLAEPPDGLRAAAAARAGGAQDLELCRLLLAWAGMVGFSEGDPGTHALAEAREGAERLDSLNDGRWGLADWLRRLAG